MPKVLDSGVRETILKVQEYFKKERQQKGPLVPYYKVNERVRVATGVSMRTIARMTNESIKASKASGEAKVLDQVEASSQVQLSSQIDSSSQVPVSGQPETPDNTATSPKKSVTKKNCQQKAKPESDKKPELQSSVIDIVMKVKEFFKLEKEEKGPIIAFEQVNNRVAISTGISLRTVTRISIEGRKAKATDGKIVAPTGKHRKPRKDKIVLDTTLIRQKIEELKMRNEVPSIRKIHNILKDDLGIKGSREIVRKHIKQILLEGKVPVTIPPNGKKQINPIKENASLQKSVFDHNIQFSTNEFNPSNMQNIQSNQIDIRIPNNNSKKSDIVNYLTYHNIEFCQDYTKQQLLEIVKCYNSEPMYALDRISTEMGNDNRARSPIAIYHCDVPSGHTIPKVMI